MQLAPGIRIGLAPQNRSAVVGVIRAVDEGSVEVDLLDDVEGDQLWDETLTMFVPQAEGLQLWSVTASQAAPSRTVTLTLEGPPSTRPRRRHARHDMALTGNIRRAGQNRRAHPAQVQILDLSSGGTKVMGTGPLSVGERVIVSFDLGSRPTKVDARIVMTYPDGHGQRIAHLAFTRTEEPTNDLLRIERYLSTLPPPLDADSAETAPPAPVIRVLE